MYRRYAVTDEVMLREAATRRAALHAEDAGQKGFSRGYPGRSDKVLTKSVQTGRGAEKNHQVNRREESGQGVN